MRPSLWLTSSASAAILSLSLSLSLSSSVMPAAAHGFKNHPGFFVCPAPCEAMFLPRDMESLDDCFCAAGAAASTTSTAVSASTSLETGARILLFGVTGEYHCPDQSTASVLHPKSFADCVCRNPEHVRDETNGRCIEVFECSGKYEPRIGVTFPKSIADCTCHEPYAKDDSTGECFLPTCPRAANYIKKPQVTEVHSLVDCDCLPPYTKNPQSGECFFAFQCPAFSSPPKNTYAKSIADCTCDWGYVSNVRYDSNKPFSSDNALCVKERPSYACPPNARTRLDTDVARNFLDCECAPEYVRNDRDQACVLAPSKHGKNNNMRGKKDTMDNIPLECPKFSIPLSPFVYSMHQCMCLPGFEKNIQLFSCDWNPNYYKCPPHSYNPTPAIVEVEFSNCLCAKGYERNDVTQSCDVIPPLHDSHCPKYAFIEHWPVRNASDCKCVFGHREDNKMVNHAFVDFERFVTDGVCAQPPPEEEFVSCPAHAVINYWPPKQLSDCSCKAGYDYQQRVEVVEHAVTVPPQKSLSGATTTTSKQTTITFQCVKVLDATSDACPVGMRRSIGDNKCRFLHEDVDGGRTPNSSTKTKANKKPVAHDNEKRTVQNKQGKVVVNGNELDFVLVENNIMVTQGDIAVGEYFVLFEEDEDPTNDIDFYMLHGYYSMETDNRWKNARMCFFLDNKLNHRRLDIMAAMEHISTNTGFSFIECHNAMCEDRMGTCDDYVVLAATQAASCFSYVGRVGGMQTLGVSETCAQGNLVHTLLHALGLHHPVVRKDRNAHVHIAYECVADAKRSYFAVEDHYDDAAIMQVPYDFYSIMHHPADAFANNTGAKDDCMTVFPIIEDPYERQAVLNEMGQRELMSYTDIHYVWALYPELLVLPTPATTKNGTTAGSTTKTNTNNANDLVEAADMSAPSPAPEYHESRLHTKADAIDNSRPKSNAANVIGAIVAILFFLGVVVFAVIEVRKARLRNRDAEHAHDYNESLLTDPVYD